MDSLHAVSHEKCGHGLCPWISEVPSVGGTHVTITCFVIIESLPTNIAPVTTASTGDMIAPSVFEGWYPASRTPLGSWNIALAWLVH